MKETLAKWNSPYPGHRCCQSPIAYLVSMNRLYSCLGHYTVCYLKMCQISYISPWIQRTDPLTNSAFVNKRLNAFRCIFFFTGLWHSTVPWTNETAGTFSPACCRTSSCGCSGLTPIAKHCSWTTSGSTTFPAPTWSVTRGCFGCGFWHWWCPPGPSGHRWCWGGWFASFVYVTFELCQRLGTRLSASQYQRDTVLDRNSTTSVGRMSSLLITFIRRTKHVLACFFASSTLI